MITETILDILFTIINVFLSLLPAIPEFSYLEGITGFVELVGYGSIFINQQVFLACLTVWFALWQFEFLYSILEWIWKKIPGVN